MSNDASSHGDTEALNHVRQHMVVTLRQIADCLDALPA